MEWLGWFIPRPLLRRRWAESLGPPHPQDLEQLGELRRQGSRLELPHPVRAFVSFGSEQAAREALGLLGRQGFSCQVRARPDGSWAVTAVVRLVPTPGSIARLREQVQTVAARLGGEYLGWQAPTVR